MCVGQVCMCSGWRHVYVWAVVCVWAGGVGGGCAYARGNGGWSIASMHVYVQHFLDFEAGRGAVLCVVVGGGGLCIYTCMYVHVYVHLRNR